MDATCINSILPRSSDLTCISNSGILVYLQNTKVFLRCKIFSLLPILPQKDETNQRRVHWLAIYFKRARRLRRDTIILLRVPSATSFYSIRVFRMEN